MGCRQNCCPTQELPFCCGWWEKSISLIHKANWIQLPTIHRQMALLSASITPSLTCPKLWNKVVAIGRLRHSIALCYVCLQDKPAAVHSGFSLNYFCSMDTPSNWSCPISSTEVVPYRCGWLQMWSDDNDVRYVGVGPQEYRKSTEPTKETAWSFISLCEVYCWWSCLCAIGYINQSLQVCKAFSWALSCPEDLWQWGRSVPSW